MKKTGRYFGAILFATIGLSLAVFAGYFLLSVRDFALIAGLVITFFVGLYLLLAAYAFAKGGKLSDIFVGFPW